MADQHYILNKINGQRILNPLPFEVAENDVPGYIGWNNAMSIANTMGDGWRLPTKGEMETMVKFKLLLDLKKRAYWTAEEDGSTAYSIGLKWYIPTRFVIKASTMGVRFVKS